mmetsp:Transcript_75983/g.216876  ORF Transcript_75983/g.216876 Transcript_75983/m.216876 type:complete len:80 (-) Transcript_75983:103-342(-)
MRARSTLEGDELHRAFPVRGAMFARPQPSHREAYPTPAPQGEQIFAFELPCSLRTFWLAFWVRLHTTAPPALDSTAELS